MSIFTVWTPWWKKYDKWNIKKWNETYLNLPITIYLLTHSNLSYGTSRRSQKDMLLPTLSHYHRMVSRSSAPSPWPAHRDYEVDWSFNFGACRVTRRARMRVAGARCQYNRPQYIGQDAGQCVRWSPAAVPSWWRGWTSRLQWRHSPQQSL